jgi:oxepin-CoA hydrolase/3-oxo-5,6-dehydrosuberyl-CoA semialdehyde dehydrogenase
MESVQGESTGHGFPLPHTNPGGPGRAGGGEELGGLRSVLHHMLSTGDNEDLVGRPSTVAARVWCWQPNPATSGPDKDDRSRPATG